MVSVMWLVQTIMSLCLILLLYGHILKVMRKPTELYILLMHT